MESHILIRRAASVSAPECLADLQSQQLRKIDDLPHAVGIYALADHTGLIRYIGMTAAASFRDRIYSRHVNGSEERSHKLACNYNIGRMWRDRKSPGHVPVDANIAKRLRKEFIRRHCWAACVPLTGSQSELKALETEILRLAPPEMVAWNATRKRVNRLPEPRDLVDALIRDFGWGPDERAALERQACSFEMHGHASLAP
jgi:hypothetical protein